jgi:hypothetical protein
MSLARQGNRNLEIILPNRNRIINEIGQLEFDSDFDFDPDENNF